MKKIVVDTGIIAGHLLEEKERSLLRRLSAAYFCYTTVFNAIELFSACSSLKETRAVEEAMDALKVLGINPKSAGAMARQVVRGTHGSYAPLIAGMCVESRLPLVTAQPKRFRGAEKVTLIDPRTLLQDIQ